MKEAMRGNTPVVTVHQGDARKSRKRIASRCSVCARRFWLRSVHMVEPEGVPEPRLSWVLCKRCHQALLVEMDRSPVLSPLRLRIAMGMVAAEYWPHAYPTRVRAYVSDRKWIVFIAAGFFIAMIVHLALIVMVAGLK